MVRLTGQNTVSVVMDLASSRPIVSTRLLFAVARGAADGTVDRAGLAAGPVEVDPDLGSRGHAIGLCPDELHLEPVAAVAGILEQDIVRLVAGDGAADFDEEVEVAVAVPVGERDAVPLLEMAGARRLPSRPRTAARPRS